ncbi:hypothetical protein DUNSADRAFT_14893 [Dunaliella salina]|uniref:Cilia- and flagella-associated protein 157 n=1 Tax=Dunaliella salina TaxID=3046 RepID=A0ABQ7G6H0_DUNSA|nr:hypothetical protein DUNSADRAFT_14893 [Dunaliella salina]|eukprot:KAF5830206.1 hypothetical protein DUNSADRAFT_14893 [Dunaliella salina]
MPGKGKNSKKLRELEEQLHEAEKSNQQKEQELKAFQQAVRDARQQVEELERDNASTAQLEQTVQQLLTRQRETTREYSDYENRVLLLELQSLVDRYRMMDVEHLEDDNHQLREEVFRLQAENMQLSRAVSENSMRTRRDLARIEIAMEGTVRERLLAARKTIMDQLTSQLDVKTRLLLNIHGELQEAMISLADQVTVLDDKYRTLSMQRRQFKVDSELGESMSKLQSRQLVVLRHQLDHAFLVNSDQKARLEKEEARAEQADAEAQRANAMAFRLTRELEKMRGITNGPKQPGLQESDSDSAFGLAGEEFETEVASLSRQLAHVKARQERMAQQRDHWRDRCLLYERACSQLQASLHALQGQVQLRLPSGHTQGITSVWSSKADADGTLGKLVEAGGQGQSKGSFQGWERSEDGNGSEVHGAMLSTKGGAGDSAGRAAGGEWLRGTAVRAQSARMRRSGVGVGSAGRPTSAAAAMQGLHQSQGAHGNTRGQNSGSATGSGVLGSSESGSRSVVVGDQDGAVKPKMRPATAAVVPRAQMAPARPFSAAAAAPASGARARPLSSKLTCASVMPRSSSSGHSTYPSTPRDSAAVLRRDMGRETLGREGVDAQVGNAHQGGLRPGSAHIASVEPGNARRAGVRPGSAVAAGGDNHRGGTGRRMGRINAAQVGWLSGLQPGWMGSQGLQQLNNQLSNAGISTAVALPVGGRMQASPEGELGMERSSDERLCRAPYSQPQLLQQQGLLEEDRGMHGRGLGGHREGGLAFPADMAIAEEEEEDGEGEEGVAEDDGGNSEDLDNVCWEEGRGLQQQQQQQQEYLPPDDQQQLWQEEQQQGQREHQEQRGEQVWQEQQQRQQQWLLEQQQQVLPLPGQQVQQQQQQQQQQQELRQQQRQQAAQQAVQGRQEEQQIQRLTSQGVPALPTAPSRLYSNEPEPFQVLYPNPAAHERCSRAPVLSTSPQRKQRKYAGSLRYFSEPHSDVLVPKSPRSSHPMSLLQQQQQLGQEGFHEASVRSADAAPPAFQPPVAAHRQLSAKKKALRLQDDPSVMFVSRQAHTKR